jgi:hypothetical protein
MARPVPDLEADEELVDMMTVAFRGSLAASTRGLALASSRSRLKQFHVWEEVAHSAGFPTDRPEMVIGVTARRIVVWKPSFWFGRPHHVVGEVPIERLINAEVYRQGLAHVLALGFKNGMYVELEAMRRRRLRRLRDAIRAQLPQKSSSS